MSAQPEQKLPLGNIAMDKKFNLVDLEGKNERLRKQLAEIDEMLKKKGARTVSDLRGVQNITTSVSKGIRPILGQEDSYQLELYLLQKEGERLVREITSIKRRRLQLERKISHIDKEIAEEEGKTLAGVTILSSELTKTRQTE